MGKNKYSDIGKKDIIRVLNQIIRKTEALEITLNFLIDFVDKDKKFDEFLNNKLGGKDELQSDDTTNGEENNSDSNENS